MKHILAQEHLHVLEKFTRSSVVVAFDYDGTLAPIVDEPEHAMMRSKTRDLLARVADAYPCIVISGRAQDDVLRKLHGVGIREAIGNHGLEPWHAANPLLQRVQKWLPVLQERLVHREGVVVENKLFSLAIHYRHAHEKRAARAAILQAARTLGNVRIIPGKMVLNILPEGAPHKGMALERARDRLGCETAIYVGDDATDEDVFGLGQPERLLSIRVGAKRSSRAEYFLRDQSEIDILLQRLVERRETVQSLRASGETTERA